MSMTLIRKTADDKVIARMEAELVATEKSEVRETIPTASEAQVGPRAWDAQARLD